MRQIEIWWAGGDQQAMCDWWVQAILLGLRSTAAQATNQHKQINVMPEVDLDLGAVACAHRLDDVNLHIDKQLELAQAEEVQYSYFHLFLPPTGLVVPTYRRAPSPPWGFSSALHWMRLRNRQWR